MHPSWLEMSYVGPSCLKEGKQYCINNRFKINKTFEMHKLQRTYPSQRCVFQGNDHGDLMEGEDLRVEKHKTMNNQNSMEPLRRENTAATHRVRGNKETVHPRKRN